MRYVPYMTLGEDLEVTHSVTDEGNPDIMVYFEKPDPIYFFKNATINLNKMLVVSREGFDDNEIRDLVDFCRDNRKSIMKYEKQGGVYLADDI